MKKNNICEWGPGVHVCTAHTIYVSIITHQSADRSSMKQYVPLKPTKHDFKVWVQADAVTSFLRDFSIYVGELTDGDSRVVGLGEWVVHELCMPLHEGKYQGLITVLPPVFCSRIS